MESIYLNVEAVNTHREKPEVGKGLCGSSWVLLKHPPLQKGSSSPTELGCFHQHVEKPAPRNVGTADQT